MGVILVFLVMEFGFYVMRLGVGCVVKFDVLDYEIGIVFEKKVGDFV